MKDFPDLPPVWLLLSGVLVWTLGWLCPVPDIAGPVSRALAIILAVAAVALGVWAALWFRARRTVIEPRHRPRALIVEGPFRLSRNPIYLAMLMLLLAEALWLGPAAGLLGVVFQWAVLRQRFILGEEATLCATFGAEAESYLSRTRRWI